MSLPVECLYYDAINDSAGDIVFPSSTPSDTMGFSSDLLGVAQTRCKNDSSGSNIAENQSTTHIDPIRIGSDLLVSERGEIHAGGIQHSDWRRQHRHDLCVLEQHVQRSDAYRQHRRRQ